MALPFLSYAQTVEQGAVEQQLAEAQQIEEQVAEQQYHIYNIVTFVGSLNNQGFEVDLDNGRKIKTLKNANGKKMKFTTPAAALMYLVSEGCVQTVQQITLTARQLPIGLFANHVQKLSSSRQYRME